MSEKRTEPRSPKAALHEDLKRAILTLKRAPGSDLDEAGLAAEYGLSRTPLREVLRNMAGEGYLELRENRGAQVSTMDHKTLRDFFLAAPMIYAAVTRLAAENAGPGQIAGLKEIQRAFRKAIAEAAIEDRVFLNNRFHEAIGEMADNVFLTPSLRRLLIDHARISSTFYRPRNAGMQAKLEMAAAQHDEMIASIEAGDGDRAEELAIAHWSLSRGMIEMFVTPQGLQAPLGKIA